MIYLPSIGDKRLMPKIISLINLKGGVGKTTTCLALADILAFEYEYKVLVIDFGSSNQSNCFIYKWRLMRSNGIPEERITGKADDREKFFAWAETLPYCIGNPLLGHNCKLSITDSPFLHPYFLMCRL